MSERRRGIGSAPSRLGEAALTLAICVYVGACARAGDASQQAPLSAFQAAKAETLVRDRLPCLGCHVVNGEGGNIGPDLSEVGSRLSHDGIARIVNDPAVARPGSLMPRTPMPPGWRELIVDYLASTGSGGSEDLAGTGAELESGYGPGAVRLAIDSTVVGAPLYATRCAACHGNAGRGDGPNAELLPVAPTEHADSTLMSARTDNALFDAIYGGGYIMNRSHRMPAFGETLSRDQIWSLVAHIRTLCGCLAPEWSRDGR